MARTPRRTTVTIDDQWVCTLSATPDQLRKGDRLTLRVTLSNPGFDGLKASDQGTVYRGFSYSYSSSNDVLNNVLSFLSDDREVTITSFPDIPDGACDIDVTVTTKSSGEGV